MRALLLAAALTSIAPQHGIAGVRLGMGKSTVLRTLGTPRKVERGENDFGRYVVFRYRTLAVTFQSGNRVTAVTTTSRSERAGSVGVGSSETQVISSIPAARCLTESGYHHCYVGNWKPGRIVTDFALRRGRVTRVTVGYVVD